MFGGAPYDDFLDAWRAERFDADAMMRLVADSGARYVVPTTKHHDGVTLWDAPGTGDRNTVRRGPRRDLVGEFRDAARRAGLRFGTYYSGGLDWHATGQPAITSDADHERRPVDAAYADYAFAHVADLIERYTPDLLWGDIEWPDHGKPDGPTSLAELFRRFYRASPDGVVNDRWGRTHWDFRTSEYEYGRDLESGVWEHCRGIGYSFGYNRLEDAEQSLSAEDAVRYFVDIVARGGNLLLNVGPTAAGELPELQRATLAGLGAWNRAHGDAIFGSRPLDAAVARASDEPWVRWTRTGDLAHAFVDAPAGVAVPLDADGGALDLDAATASPGALAEREGDRLVVTVREQALRGPVRVDLPMRARP
ncbi:alpha-L-fucosidase [Agromyces mangrovi Wang et al. 2018]|uniref:alpha-L-fucosidase n=1 Tax=Agromyces mangrovi TaxID=1858653 RepID=UPI0025740C68|nr:alpha-L-fucosidase [Agromyces mangrovi]BDZ65190.1 alpha-L-fucosidase [Agromyces mangrovi]